MYSLRKTPLEKFKSIVRGYLNENNDKVYDMYNGNVIRIGTKRTIDKWLVLAVLATPTYKINESDTNDVTLNPSFDGEEFLFTVTRRDDVSYILNNWRLIHNYNAFLDFKGKRVGQGLGVLKKYIVLSRVVRIFTAIYGILLSFVYSFKFKSKIGNKAQRAIKNQVDDLYDKLKKNLVDDDTENVMDDLVSLFGRTKKDIYDDFQRQIQTEKKNQSWANYLRGNQVEAEKQLKEFLRNLPSLPALLKNSPNPVDRNLRVESAPLGTVPQLIEYFNQVS